MEDLVCLPREELEEILLRETGDLRDLEKRVKVAEARPVNIV
jgi:hypothetical protein